MRMRIRIRDPESFRPWIRDKNPGSGINIPDPQHCLSDPNIPGSSTTYTCVRRAWGKAAGSCWGCAPADPWRCSASRPAAVAAAAVGAEAGGTSSWRTRHRTTKLISAKLQLQTMRNIIIIIFFYFEVLLYTPTVQTTERLFFFQLALDCFICLLYISSG